MKRWVQKLYTANNISEDKRRKIHKTDLMSQNNRSTGDMGLNKEGFQEIL